MHLEMNMRKFYHLSTCKTCQRIWQEIGLDPHDVTTQNIKEQPVSEEELDAMAEITGSYESLFSRRSMQYRKLGLGDADLQEADYRKYILEHYSFLKRPVLYIDNRVAAGNSKATIETMKEMLN